MCFQDSLRRITVPANRGQEEPEPMENIVLPCDVTDKVEPPVIDSTIDEILPDESQIFCKPIMLDMVWVMLRQKPTENLFTIDTRATQVIPGIYLYYISITNLCNLI